MCPHCKTIARDFGLTCPRCGTDFHTIAQVRIDIDKANPIKRSRKARNLHIGNTTQLRTSHKKSTRSSKITISLPSTFRVFDTAHYTIKWQ